MPVAIVPDMERVASDHLRTQTGARVVGQPPSSTGTAWVRVTQLDAASTHRSDHLVSYLLQFDCYAGSTGGQPEANTLARDVRKHLMQMPDSSHSGATVTGVSITGHARVPDTGFEPARERVVITAEIWAHA